jgi:hypothetical protein
MVASPSLEDLAEGSEEMGQDDPIAEARGILLSKIRDRSYLDPLKTKILEVFNTSLEDPNKDKYYDFLIKKLKQVIGFSNHHAQILKHEKYRERFWEPKETSDMKVHKKMIEDFVIDLLKNRIFTYIDPSNISNPTTLNMIPENIWTSPYYIEDMIKSEIVKISRKIQKGSPYYHKNSLERSSILLYWLRSQQYLAQEDKNDLIKSLGELSLDRSSYDWFRAHFYEAQLYETLASLASDQGKKEAYLDKAQQNYEDLSIENHLWSKFALGKLHMKRSKGENLELFEKGWDLLDEGAKSGNLYAQYDLFVKSFENSGLTRSLDQNKRDDALNYKDDLLNNHHGWTLSFLYEQSNASEKENIVRQIEEALAQKPNNSSLLDILGYDYFNRQRRVDEARKKYKKAIALDGNKRALANLGFLMYKTKKPETTKGTIGPRKASDLLKEKIEDIRYLSEAAEYSVDSGIKRGMDNLGLIFPKIFQIEYKFLEKELLKEIQEDTPGEFYRLDSFKESKKESEIKKHIEKLGDNFLEDFTSNEMCLYFLYDIQKLFGTPSFKDPKPEDPQEISQKIQNLLGKYFPSTLDILEEEFEEKNLQGISSMTIALKAFQHDRGTLDRLNSDILRNEPFFDVFEGFLNYWDVKNLYKKENFLKFVGLIYKNLYTKNISL